MLPQQNIEKETEMKIGDVVKVNDGSYAMLQDGRDKPTETTGTVLINEGNWKIVEVGNFPQFTENSSSIRWGLPREVNNLKIQSLKDNERIAYTQKRFCNNV